MTPRRKKIAPAGTPVGDEPELLRAWSADKGTFSKDEMEAWTIAKVRADKFAGTQNPVHALDSYCVSVGAGQVPDKRVLQFLETTFLRWLKAHGKQSLDTIMGLKKPGRFQPAEITALEQRDWLLFWDIAKLRSLPSVALANGKVLKSVRVSVDDAATMAIARLRRTPAAEWNLTGWMLDSPSTEWLVKKYRKVNNPPWLEELMREQVTGKWSAQDIRGYFTNFPDRKSWPVRLHDFKHALLRAA